MSDYLSKIRFQLTSVDVRPVLNTWNQVAEELMSHESFGKQLDKNRASDKAWAAAQAVLNAQQTPAEKMDVLCRFVSDNIRLEPAEGLFLARSMDDVFEKKSGSSFEMNLLLVALLRRAGFSAHPALISTRDHGQPLPTYPMLDQFNHVLAMAELEGETRIYDIGSSQRPASLPAINSLNKHAWVVNPLNPRWIDIVPAAATETEVCKLQLSEDGNLRGHIELQSDNYYAQTHREGLIGKNNAAEYWKETLHERFPELQLDSARLLDADDVYKPLGAHIHFSIPGSAQVNGDLMYATPVMFSQFYDNPFKLEQRMYPVDIPYPLKERMMIEIALPPGYQVESLPEPARLALPNNGGKFQYMAAQKEGAVVITCSLGITQLHFEPAEYDALRSFFTMVSGKLGEQLVFRKKT